MHAQGLGINLATSRCYDLSNTFAYLVSDNKQSVDYLLSLELNTGPAEPNERNNCVMLPRGWAHMSDIRRGEISVGKLQSSVTCGICRNLAGGEDRNC